MRSRPAARRPATAAGYSLVEVVAATALTSAVLVSSLELIRDGIDQSVETDRHRLLATYAVSELERRLAETAAIWGAGTHTGDFADDGAADIRFTTTCSDDPAQGGVVDALMDLQTTTYYDTNGDDTLDSDEPRCDYRTKLGRFATYSALGP